MSTLRQATMRQMQNIGASSYPFVPPILPPVGPTDTTKQSSAYNSYDSKDDFPEEGKIGVFYLDKSVNKMYYWNGTEYVAISGGSGGGGCSDDCCIWGDVINGGDSDPSDDGDCPYPHGGCGQVTADAIKEALGYTPADADAVETLTSTVSEVKTAAAAAQTAATTAKTTAQTAQTVATAVQKSVENIQTEMDDISDKADNAVENSTQAAQDAKVARNLAEAAEDEADEAIAKSSEALQDIDTIKELATDAQQAAKDAKDTAIAANIIAAEAKTAATDAATKADTAQAAIDDVAAKVDDFEDKLTNVAADLQRTQETVAELRETVDEALAKQTDWEWLGQIRPNAETNEIAISLADLADCKCTKLYVSLSINGSDTNNTTERLAIRCNTNDDDHRVATLNNAIPATAQSTRYTNLYLHMLNTKRLTGYVQAINAAPDANVMLQSLATKNAKNKEIDFGEYIESIYLMVEDEGVFGVNTQIDIYGVKV